MTWWKLSQPLGRGLAAHAGRGQASAEAKQTDGVLDFGELFKIVDFVGEDRLHERVPVDFPPAKPGASQPAVRSFYYFRLSA